MSVKYSLDQLYGEVRLSSRWVPCTCGFQYCGQCVNRRVEIGYGGKILSDQETLGVKTVCDGIPPKLTLWDKLFGRMR